MILHFYIIIYIPKTLHGNYKNTYYNYYGRLLRDFNTDTQRGSKRKRERERMGMGCSFVRSFFCGMLIALKM